MKTLCGAALLSLAAALICGCASKHAGAVYHAGDETPPDFLVGPVAVVLTNLNGFSAHVSSTITSPDEKPLVTFGELLGRDGRLIYQPSAPAKHKKARTAAGLFFIWDEGKHSGYVLSDALQSYAPIKTEVEAASQLSISKEGVQEVVNGHPCHRCEAEVALDNGLKAHMTLWQADDARHFPVRIATANGPKHMTLDFSEIRQEYPAQTLFMPPDGFTAYDTSVALMNELIVREASIARRNAAGEFGEPGDVRPSDWHDSPSGSNLGRQ